MFFIVPLTLIILGASVFACMALYMIAIDDDDDVLTGVLVTSILVAVLSAVVIGAGVVRRKGRMPSLMLLSALLAPPALVAWLVSLWTGIANPGNDDRRLIVLAMLLTVASVGFTYTGLMTLQPTRSTPLRALRGLLISGAWLFGLTVTTIVTIAWIDPRLLWEWMFLLFPFMQMLALAILIGSLVVPMAVRNHARQQARPRESVSSTLRMSMICPRCDIDLEVMQGPARCDACGLTMLIEVEEPRCECGYLLFALTTPTCPECGRTIEHLETAGTKNEMQSQINAE